jgi:8-oxo-dGTP diphosphatase
MIRVPVVAVIIENAQGEILMLLRDDKPNISCPNHWSLAGGKVENGETPEFAAHRELLEEIGVDLDLTLWKRYDRQHPSAIADQYIYLGKFDLPLESLTLGEGQDMRFFNPHEVKNLKMAFEFDTVLEEYFFNHS